VLAFDDVDTQTPTQSITPCDQTGALNTIRGSRIPCNKIKKFDSFLLQCQTPIDINLRLERKIMKFIILNVQINNNSSFTSIKQGPRPTI